MSPRRVNSSIMRSRESSVEPMSNCSSASGGWVCADAAAVMQAVESQTLILYHTDLRGEWAREAALKACGAGIGAWREVCLSPGHARCRGELWYAHALGVFPGAAACVMTSFAMPELTVRTLSLEELFAR